MTGVGATGRRTARSSGPRLALLAPRPLTATFGGATVDSKERVMNVPTAMRRSLRTMALPAIILLATSIHSVAFAQPEISREIAPQAKLRVAILAANPILITKKPDGSTAGVAVDLGRFIAERLGVPFDLVPNSSAEAYTAGFGKGE